MQSDSAALCKRLLLLKLPSRVERDSYNQVRSFGRERASWAVSGAKLLASLYPTSPQSLLLVPPPLCNAAAVPRRRAVGRCSS